MLAPITCTRVSSRRLPSAYQLSPAALASPSATPVTLVAPVMSSRCGKTRSCAAKSSPDRALRSCAPGWLCTVTSARRSWPARLPSRASAPAGELSVAVGPGRELVRLEQMGLADREGASSGGVVLAGEQDRAVLVVVAGEQVRVQAFVVACRDAQLAQFAASHACACSAEPSAVSSLGFQAVWRSET